MEKLLNQYFGYSSFRPGQKELIDLVANGHSALGILPTGGGKSITYQIPGLVLGGLTLVLSPLISLMKDQVDALNATGIKAACLNSNLSKAEEREIISNLKQGEYQFLYVAPERFNQSYFQSLITQLNIKLIVFDEAHCISKWGHDFRPGYREVINYVYRFNVPLMAVTATATVDVKEDIMKLLNVPYQNVVETSTKRDNLIFTVNPTYQRERFVIDYLKRHKDDSGIIYASTRKQVEALGESLKQEGIDCVIYHAGLNKDERAKNQAIFVNDETPVMIATNAFGMGIDKSNVRFVIHYNMPQDLESYYQEAGRAGRDGLLSECILMFTERDIALQEFFISQTIDVTIMEMKKDKLNYMIRYTKTPQCLQSEIIQYFNNSEHLTPCGMCSNCTRNKNYNMTTEAQKILSCMIRMKEPVTKGLLIQVLRGEVTTTVSNKEFHDLSTFGLLKEFKTKDITGFIETLKFNGYIDEFEGKYYVHESASKLLKGNQTLMTDYKEVTYQEKVIINTVKDLDEVLFKQLKEVRKSIAKEKEIPPFTVFSDKTLQLFAKKQPTTKAEMIQIEGVGSYKLKHYCPNFIEAIKKYKQNS